MTIPRGAEAMAACAARFPARRPPGNPQRVPVLTSGNEWPRRVVSDRQKLRLLFVRDRARPVEPLRHNWARALLPTDTI
jgi:hypothetical protein